MPPLLPEDIHSPCRAVVKTINVHGGTKAVRVVKTINVRGGTKAVRAVKLINVHGGTKAVRAVKIINVQRIIRILTYLSGSYKFLTQS